MSATEEDTMQAVPAPTFTICSLKPLTPPGEYETGQESDFDTTFFSNTMSETSSRAAIADSLIELGIPVDEDDEIFNRPSPAKIAQSVEDDGDSLGVMSDSSLRAKPKYVYEDVIFEAEEMYEDGQPEFCIKNKGKANTKFVKDIKTDQEVEMTYKQWKDKEYGY